MKLREAIKELIREVLREELEVTKKGVTKEEPKGLADWDNAPEDAMWHAVDSDGYGFFYVSEPKASNLTDQWIGGDAIPINNPKKHQVPDWTKTLEKRPERSIWDDAPDWAMWHAVGEDGESFWYKIKPRMYMGMWFIDGKNRHHCKFHKYPNNVDDWKNSLQKRP